jgi:hypothetical protein
MQHMVLTYLNKKHVVLTSHYYMFHNIIYKNISC